MDNKDLMAQYKKAMDANAFANYNGIVVDKIEENFVEAHMDVTEESLNPFGSVHGGAYFTLADVTAGFASRAGSRVHVTRSASMTFLRPAVSGRITCHAEVINRSHTFCLSEARIYDENGKLICTGTFDYCCVDKPIQNKTRWTDGVETI